MDPIISNDRLKVTINCVHSVCQVLHPFFLFKDTVTVWFRHEHGDWVLKRLACDVSCKPTMAQAQVSNITSVQENVVFSYLHMLFCLLVAVEGLEPSAKLMAVDFESTVYTSSTIRPMVLLCGGIGGI